MGSVGDFPWNDQWTAELRRMIEVEKVSFGRAADELSRLAKHHLTRSAAIGKARRIGVTSPGDKGGKMRAMQERIAAKMRLPSAPRVIKPLPPRPAPGPLATSMGGAFYINQGAVRERAVDVALPPLAELNLAPTATIHTLGRHACKWPIGDPLSDDFGFCGRPAERTYCADHKPLGVNPPKRKFDPDNVASQAHRLDERGAIYRY